MNGGESTGKRKEIGSEWGTQEERKVTVTEDGYGKQ